MSTVVEAVVAGGRRDERHASSRQASARHPCPSRPTIRSSCGSSPGRAEAPHRRLPSAAPECRRSRTIMAMPPPIVPAPTTRRAPDVEDAACPSARLRPSPLRARRRTCARSAFDSIDTTQSAKSSRSRTEPASKGTRQRGFDGRRRPRSGAPDAFRDFGDRGPWRLRTRRGRPVTFSWLIDDVARRRISVRRPGPVANAIAPVSECSRAVDDRVDDACRLAPWRPTPACRRCTSRCASSALARAAAAAGCRPRRE